MTEKKQIVIVHGGTTFARQEEYLSYLKFRDVTLDTFLMHRDWKPSLPAALGEGYEILVPQMPNKTDARFEEWVLWFDRIVPFLKDGTVLVGHSLGGIFLAKYLSVRILPKKIGALILIAAPFDAVAGESLGDFALPVSLSGTEKQVEKIFLFYSKDDPVVPFEQMIKYEEAFPKAVVKIFTDRQHFNQEEFPELIQFLREV